MTPALREPIAAPSRDEKLELMNDLWDELHEVIDAEPIPEELKEELDRRKAEYEADPSSGMSLDEVIAAARARYDRWRVLIRSRGREF